jgi:ATP-dependent DNA helicase RecG
VLQQPCETLAGVGPTISGKLRKCGIVTLADLLLHLPYRYQDRTRITAIRDLRPNDWSVIIGRVCKTEVKYGKRMMLNCLVEDKTGILTLRFFHFNKQQIQAFSKSTLIRAFGEVRQFSNSLEMIHPEYQLLSSEEAFTVEEALTPIYPTTQGLSQTRLRQLIHAALKTCRDHLENWEWMSAAEIEELGFYSIPKALELLHRPPPDTPLLTLEEGKHPALARLAFDELLAHRLSLQFARHHRNALSAPSIDTNTELCTRFLEQLPFRLTPAQRRVSEEVANDLAQSKPMLRLVQGDVGSGKTVIAALAALQAIAQGYQVAFMAPTELLSEQHATNFKNWIAPLGISCQLLSGNIKTNERKKILALLANGSCQLLIGTHALFQEDVDFAKLGLVVIDEQHRFGVEQRLLLQQKGQKAKLIPHQLLLTATPIPRTLAMTHFAHLDLSVIDELPPNRKPIDTSVLNQEKREFIIQRLEEAIAAGRQVYWVCTLIEESEKLQCKAAAATAENLQTRLNAARVGLIHGRMKSPEKEAIMTAFKQGEIHLLVSTTVIEVGVDVANASLMIIENAERLGLAQLHQLRGRVGRGSQQSYCLLLYQAPLSDIAAERLRLMRSTNDGFIIAEKDLQLRGAGEVLGTKQTGYRQMKIANIQRDRDLLPLITKTAKRLISEQMDVAHIIAQRWLGQFEHFLQG